jgi:CRISPR-associated protein Cas1
MKKLLNTVYVTTAGAWLAKENETMVVRQDEEILGRVPLHAIGSVVCFGNVSCSPWLMEACCSKGIAISWFTATGKFLARVEGRASGNILLRRQQYRNCDDADFSMQVTRHIVAAKLANSRNILQRALRDHSETMDADAVRNAVSRLKSTIRRTLLAEDIYVIRGLEGEGAREYFAVFDELITVRDEVFRFEKRTRRPPMNNINCLLSFVYTLLVHDCRSAVEAVGLDSQAGYLHRDRPGRPSLALDIMEEFRAPLADRLVCSLINRQQIGGSDFHKSLSGGVQMKDTARKTLLTAWQLRKQDEIQHPFLNEKVPIGVCFHLQAQLFARYTRGELDAYPAFLWK